MKIKAKYSYNFAGAQFYAILINGVCVKTIQAINTETAEAWVIDKIIMGDKIK